MKNQKAIFYLGVEGGATKSEAVLADSNGDILSKATGKAVNYHYLGKEIAARHFQDLIFSLLKIASGGKLFAVFGLAGLDTGADENSYKKILKSILPNSAVFKVYNDTKIGLEARCPKDENRIIVISGTGANVHGEGKGNSARSIGWGLILGDEGSAYYVGLKAMRAAIHSWDGRGTKSVFEELVLKKTGSKSMEDFVSKVYKFWGENSQNIKNYVASFAPLVDEAILKNDSIALTIRDESAEELAKGVFATASRLDFKKKSFCLGTIGSMWKMPGFEEIFKKQVQKICPKVRFSDNTDSGAWGAVLLAKKLKA